MKNRLLYVTLILSLLFIACSKNDVPDTANNNPIEIYFRVIDFTQNNTRGTKEAGSDAEQKVNNLYLFLFDNAGANPERYYIENATFTGGTWDAAAMKVRLDMTQVNAGDRQVYVIANIDAALKASLDGVTSVAALQSVFKTTAQPWSSLIASPFLMTGNRAHNFAQNYQLDNVQLIRAVAKVEINIELSDKLQTIPADVQVGGNLGNFKYRYVNFDTRTYVVKPASKPDNIVNSTNDTWPIITGWTPWGASLNVTPAPDAGTGYILNSASGVTRLQIITYLNERDNKGAAIEIALPGVDDGELPPPEFGPELYRLPLPDKIQRNHWYKYNIQI